MSEEKETESRRISMDALAAQNEKDHDYQSLFWVPMLYQTADTAIHLVEDMIGLIDEYGKKSDGRRPSVLGSANHSNNDQVDRKNRKKKQIILGDDSFKNEVVATRVEVVTKSEDTIYLILSVLKSHFLFSRLHDYELQDVVDSMVDEYFSEGDEIISQGDIGHKLYVLEDGDVEVIKDGKFIVNLPKGVIFGDLALMYNSPRAATIRALSDCTLWTLEKRFFRQAMVTSSSNQTVQLSQFLGKLKLFETLSMESLSQLSKSLTLKTYSDDQYIITQGEIGDNFYIVYKGQVKVTKTLDDGSQIFLITLGEGNVFGERALIKKEPRAANIISDGDVECYSLSSKDFASMLGSIVDEMTELNNFRLLRSAPVFEDLSDYRLTLVKDSLSYHDMFTGQRLLCDSVHFFIILDGQVFSPDGIVYKSGDVLGNMTENADDQAISITCKSEECRVALIAREAVVDHLENQKTDIDEKEGTAGGGADGDSQEDGDEAAITDMSICEEKRNESAKIRLKQAENYQLNGKLDGLEILKPLGKGTFGNVYLAAVKSDKEGERRSVALKVLDKASLIKASQTMYLRRECTALHLFSSPFIGQFYDIVVTPRKVFLSLEYISAGELWYYLYEDKQHQRGLHGGLLLEHLTVFLAMITLALEHIHGLGYCYRDLKPENLLVTHEGGLKIVDFGFAKSVPFLNEKDEVQYRTFTLCGTPDYMAPEIVLTQGHDRSSDFWALGVLAYECLCTCTPFEGLTQERTFEKIVHSQRFLTFPNHVDPHLKSFVRRLMHPNASLRLGALQNGYNDIKSHALFTSTEGGKIDFEGIANGTIKSTFVSQMDNTAEEVDEQDRFEASLKLDMEVIDIEEELSFNEEGYEYGDALMDLMDLGTQIMNGEVPM
jgi:serine/threonine protein kinase/CRP-like cAMP-binding protein